MIIQGPMGIVADRATGTKEAMWVAVESGQAAAIAKGELCVWDFADYSATAGILQNTRGLRVLVCPTAEAGDNTSGVVRLAGFAHKDIAAFTAFATSRGPIALLQTYGFRSDLTANTDAASNILQGGAIVPSGDAAGAVEGPQDVTSPTVAEVSKMCGFSFVVVAANTTVTASLEAFIKI